MTPSASELLRASAGELARRVRERELSPVELFELHAARIAELDPELNALVLPRLEEARVEAQAAERALAAGEPVGPLHGVPFTTKDAVAVAGMRTTNGSKVLPEEVPARDAPAVARLRAAGAILLGKTNVPEFCAFYDTINDLFGATRNPHAPDRSAGGSSGGEAAAVASGMSAFGLGSDLASSIRNPAHFTGIFGLCPSHGILRFAGHAPESGTPGWQRFAELGPLARSADDLELLLGVLAEHPPAPPRGQRGPVGVYEDDIVQPVARVCREAVRRAATALADAGHALVEDRPPHQERIRELFDLIVGSEIARTLRPLVAGRVAELSRYGRLAVASHPAEDPPLAAYLDAWSALEPLVADVGDWFERRALALCPVGPGAAPPLGTGFTEIDGEPVRPGGKFALCTLANAAGLPAASVPVMRTGDGLPVGVQLIGGRGRDLEVIAAARTLEAAFGGAILPDGGTARNERRPGID